MVLPLVPILGGVAAGSLASNFLGDSGDNISTSTTTTDSRSYSIQYPTYQVQIDSPAASQTTKKEAVSSASPKVTTETGGGTDLSILFPIAAILAAAYVGKELVK